ncbi:MAG: tyrosine--tRNA ligase [Deltaproteobacteria bacterium]|jgi:tyrosyl-tRNA synthetase|nr:tyrosine--tRNA ligase [Deltaproteobacteria bacterium]
MNTRQNTYHILQERGFTYQTTDEEALNALFEQEQVTGYIGFDATADSLHVGHLLPLMALSWMDLTGHKPIALVGGGTSMVGDPSGRTEARRLMTEETIKANLEGIRPQAERFLDLNSGRASLLDNSEWLLRLNYVPFLRDIGRHFSVNRMLTADCYKSRLEEGLSFLEFNYMVMQAYDFLKLFEIRGNRLQLGGQDQWGNIVAGVDLIRRVHGGQAYGLTMPLLIDPRTGDKFGKTNAGAVWLSPAKTPVYDFYQFWRNIDDQEAFRLLSLFTYLPMTECRYLSTLPGNLINRAKEILAYEVTAICHGHEASAEAFLASVRAFGAADPKGEVETTSKIKELTSDRLDANLPTMSFEREVLEKSDLAQLFVLAELAASKGEARRLIRQGGAYLNDRAVSADEETLIIKGSAWLDEGQVTLRAGKKRYKIIKVISRT